MKKSSIAMSIFAGIGSLISGVDISPRTLKKTQVSGYAHSKGKAFTKGKRSKSLKIRSNRRKG